MKNFFDKFFSEFDFETLAWGISMGGMIIIHFGFLLVGFLDLIGVVRFGE